MKKLFVDEEIRVLYDKSAEENLIKTNDLNFFNQSEEGIHKVSEERWKLAQKYEKKTWMGNRGANDDRNLEHLQRFETLNSIKESEIKEIIELGCGPFTNMRLISDIIKPEKITLLDPLISDYLNHPNCTYKKGVLNGYDVDLIPSSIENAVITSTFDAVVMINVIEHCFDVDSIFSKINSILKKGGYFIFSDVYFDDVKLLATNIYDAGHPLRLSKNKLEELLESFEVVYEKRFNGLYSQEWRNDIYFIGKKK